MFTKNELEWIQKLIEDKTSEMIEEGKYDFFEYDKDIL